MDQDLEGQLQSPNVSSTINPKTQSIKDYYFSYKRITKVNFSKTFIRDELSIHVKPP